MRQFKVATFYHAHHNAKEPMLNYVTAYTRDYQSSWVGCILYTVQAVNGAAAKLDARRQRLAHERARDPRVGGMP